MTKNINPAIWGPICWKMLEHILSAYPDNPTREEADSMYNFITAFGQVLPCEKCRANFESHLEKYPLSDEVLSSNKNINIWLINIHNEVNATTGKQKYNQKNYLPIVIIIIIFIIAILVYFIN